MPAIVKKYWGQTIWVLAVAFALGANLKRLDVVETNQKETKQMVEQIRGYCITNSFEISAVRDRLEILAGRQTAFNKQ